MANKRNGTLYTGASAHLAKRVFEHGQGPTPSFTQRYSCKLLVWYEAHATMPDAIAREKQIKAAHGRRSCS